MYVLVMFNEQFWFGSDAHKSNVTGSDCYICKNDGGLWRNSVEEVLQCLGKNDLDNHEVQKYWAKQNAVTACQNGHLFDEKCIDRYEKTYAERNNNERLHCPLCRNNEYVWPKSDRRVFKLPMLSKKICPQKLTHNDIARSFRMHSTVIRPQSGKTGVPKVSIHKFPSPAESDTFTRRDRDIYFQRYIPSSPGY